MMYDHEKSDPAIVAVKPTNKAGQSAAELVEPRAGAEGNVRQQSTGRAQYRVRVTLYGKANEKTADRAIKSVQQSSQIGSSCTSRCRRHRSSAVASWR